MLPTCLAFDVACRMYRRRLDAIYLMAAPSGYCGIITFLRYNGSWSSGESTNTKFLPPSFKFGKSRW